MKEKLEKLKSVLTKCVGVVGKKVTDTSEKVEAMVYIMDKVKGTRIF